MDIRFVEEVWSDEDRRTTVLKFVRGFDGTVRDGYVNDIPTKCLDDIRSGCVKVIDDPRNFTDSEIDEVKKCIESLDVEISVRKGNRKVGNIEIESDDFNTVFRSLMHDYDIIIGRLVEGYKLGLSLSTEFLVEVKCVILSTAVAFKDIEDCFARMELSWVNKKLEERRSAGEYDENSFDKIYAKRLSVAKYRFLKSLELYPNLINSNIVKKVVANFDEGGVKEYYEDEDVEYFHIYDHVASIFYGMIGDAGHYGSFLVDIQNTVRCGSIHEVSAEILLIAKYKIFAINSVFPGFGDIWVEWLLYINEELERRNFVGEYDKSKCKYKRIIRSRFLFDVPEGSNIREMSGVDEFGNVIYSKDTVYWDELYIGIFSKMRNDFIENVNKYSFLKKGLYVEVVEMVMANLDAESKKIGLVCE